MEQLWAQVALSLVSAVVAGFLVHWLTRRRDKESARRQQRVGYLVSAYRNLERAAHSDLDEHRTQLEDAYAEIVLFGDSRHIKLAETFVHDLTATNRASLDDLLGALREDLRRELGLSTVPLRRVPSLRVGNAAAPIQFDSAWATTRREIVLSLAETRHQTRSAPGRLGEIDSKVVRAPGAAVAESFQAVIESLRDVANNRISEAPDMDSLTLARSAADAGIISGASLTAIEGLQLLATLAHQGGRGTGLTVEQAQDYVHLAMSVVDAIVDESADTTGPR